MIFSGITTENSTNNYLINELQKNDYKNQSKNNK